MTNPSGPGPFSDENKPPWQPPPMHPITTQPWTWQSEGPPGKRGLSTIGLVAVITLSVGGVIAMLILYTLAMGEAHDAFQFDDDAVRQRATEVCAALFAATDALDEREFDEPSDRIAAENTALLDLINDFELLGEKAMKQDKPAVTWRNDWQELATVRAEYATALRNDPLAARPAMPLTRATRGYPISRRLSDLHTGCAVPLAILDDFEFTPFRDLEKCTYARGLGVCATTDGETFIDGLTPGGEADVWVRFGDAVSQSTRTSDAVGRITLAGVVLGTGTVVVVDAVIDGRRSVVMAA